MTDENGSAENINKVIALLEQAIAELKSARKDKVADKVVTKPAAPVQFSPDALGEIKVLSRDEAVGRLDKFSHKELGEIFVLSGGGKADKKRAKEWLKSRILFYLFDFGTGHDIVKGNGDNGEK